LLINLYFNQWEVRFQITINVIVEKNLF
jgi:hypothetical protein